MSMPIEALETELLRLSPADRARLLDRVVASLDKDKQRDQAWDRIASMRDAEIERGESVPVPAAEVLARLRSELN